jgi:polyisoprenoid-binding protein YceI
VRKLLGLGLAAVAVAAFAAPAGAWTCSPHLSKETVEVGGQDVTYFRVEMIC